MLQKFKYIIYSLVILLLATNSLYAVEIMSLAEIKPGMSGIGKTVFQAYEVEEFPVEIIDILRDEGLGKDLILIRAGGEKIDAIGGIAAGMSGSPIYVDDKLIGAIGYGWEFSDHHYALVTPIEQMLALLADPETDLAVPELFTYSTPLLVNGIQGRALERLEKTFQPYGFNLYHAGGLQEAAPEGQSLEPGSAIAVQLVRGDINVSAIGTVSYIDKQKILAFGHPFFNKGEVSYLLSKAYINGVIPSIAQPFKLGSPEKELLGTIEVDRGAGIAGRLNVFPKIIPLRVRVYDRYLRREKVINVQLVRDEDLLTSLVTNVALQAIDSTLDRVGKGTAWVNYKITASKLPEMTVEVENIYYSRSDIGAMALTDFYQLLNFLVHNPFEEVNLIDLRLDIEVDQVDKVALIQEAKVLNEKIQPGDQLEIELTLHPYRDEPFVQKVSLALPEDIQTGRATVVIDGGFTGQSSLPEEAGESELNQAVVAGYKDFASILEDYLERPKNNDLIIQVFPSYALEVYQQEEKETEDDEETSLAEQEEEAEIKEIIASEYVLEGSLNLDIQIEDVLPKAAGEEEERKKI